MKQAKQLLIICLALLPIIGYSQVDSLFSQQPGKTLIPVIDLRAADHPNDAGNKVDLSWTLPGGLEPADIQEIHIYRSTSPEGPFVRIGTTLPTETQFTDQANDETHHEVKPGQEYYYKVALYDGANEIMSQATNAVTPGISFFNWGRLNVFIILAIFFGLILYFIRASRQGKDLFIRMLPGLEALEESIGRATEMGKPVLYMPGIDEANNIQTLYSMVILRHVTQMVAEYETPLIVTVGKAFVVPLAEETVRQGYMDAGRPDLFNQDIVRYYSDEQFAVAAAVSGVIVRERPATNIFLGSFYAESLILAETGFLTGAIQIAGTGNIHQLPFFVVACDYTLIGEEFYAASAYLSDDPKLIGPLKAADWVKILTIGFIAIGAVLETLGIHLFSQLLTIQ